MAYKWLAISIALLGPFSLPLLQCSSIDVKLVALGMWKATTSVPEKHSMSEVVWLLNKLVQFKEYNYTNVNRSLLWNVLKLQYKVKSNKKVTKKTSTKHPSNIPKLKISHKNLIIHLWQRKRRSILQSNLDSDTSHI